ncbi:MAG: hypothetical protein ABEJ96_05945 [Thiohalorhabdaceae bacterium]
MERRTFLQGATAVGILGASGVMGGCSDGGGEAPPALSVADLPPLSGDLTVYLGRGEGGLYSKVVDAIRERNPDLNLSIRRGPSSALANTLVEDAERGGARADLFWSIDASSLGRVIDQGLARPVPAELRNRVREPFRFESMAPVTGRVPSPSPTPSWRSRTLTSASAGRRPTAPSSPSSPPCGCSRARRPP